MVDVVYTKCKTTGERKKEMDKLSERKVCRQRHGNGFMVMPNADAVVQADVAGWLASTKEEERR